MTSPLCDNLSTGVHFSYMNRYHQTTKFQGLRMLREYYEEAESVTWLSPSFLCVKMLRVMCLTSGNRRQYPVKLLSAALSLTAI